MAHLRGASAAALAALLCMAAVWGSPLPEESPADALSESGGAEQPKAAETGAPDAGETADPGNTTDQETTIDHSEENHSTEKSASAAPDFEKRSAEGEAEDLPKDQEFHILAKRHGEQEDGSKREKGRRRRGEESSESGPPELTEGEGSKSEESFDLSTESSGEESSADSAPTDTHGAEQDEHDEHGEHDEHDDGVEGGHAAAVQSADAISSDEKTETSTGGGGETTAKSDGSADATAASDAPSDAAAPSADSGDTSAGPDVSESRRRRRRVPLKEEIALEDPEQLSNDTEPEVDESVKSVALNQA